ncbi:glycosyltransferase family 1 protein [Corallincola luteus]|uniref:Glycosyltransferase family 1 protein n=1 Tax=Corallincola luteus TaxID=1775177 RepID=A0ABY2AME4_9GAMM|nr:glycosyltransferase family 4 protein [Corallincola luteus]TCI04117.1 glycosyltransferase family 1 protein [Corallincola luteus]
MLNDNGLDQPHAAGPHICHVNLARGFSGGEQQTFNLVQALKQHGIQQSVVLLKGSPLLPMFEAIGIPVHEVRHHLFSCIPPRGIRPTLFHAHDGKAAYWCAIQARLLNLPYIITRRVDNPVKKQWIAKKIYKKATVVACLSRAIAKQVKILDKNIHTTIIPSGYSGFAAQPDAVQQIKNRYPNKILIAQIGKLLHHKGYHVTIEVARQCEASHPQYQFLFLGSGPDELMLKKQAEGLTNIDFLGHQTDIGSYLSAVDILLFPSLSEGLGSTILEAWQHGTPVIGSDAGGIPDLITDEETGKLVAPGDALQLQQALITLIEDEQKRNQYCENALERLADYSPESIAARYYTLYKEL